MCPDVGEIIVADNKSSDATALLASSFGCHVVPGGRPAVGRNAGARVAKGEVILFIDADAVLSAATFAKINTYFSSDQGVGIHFPLRPLGADRFATICYGVMDTYVRTLARLGISQGVGTFIAARRNAFEAIGGFREEIAAGEDADFIRRLSRVGPVLYDRTAVVYASARRFKIENCYVFAAKTIFWACLRLLGTSASIFQYRWASYPKEIAAFEDGEMNALLHRKLAREWV